MAVAVFSFTRADVGDAVKEDEVIVVIETDKQAVEIAASVTGVITKQYAGKDVTVEVGKPLVDIDEGGAGKSAPAAAPAPTPKPAAVGAPAATPAPAPAASGSTSTSYVWCVWHMCVYVGILCLV